MGNILARLFAEPARTDVELRAVSTGSTVDEQPLQRVDAWLSTQPVTTIDQPVASEVVHSLMGEVPSAPHATQQPISVTHELLILVLPRLKNKEVRCGEVKKLCLEFSPMYESFEKNRKKYYARKVCLRLVVHHGFRWIKQAPPKPKVLHQGFVRKRSATSTSKVAHLDYGEHSAAATATAASKPTNRPAPEDFVQPPFKRTLRSYSDLW